MFWKSEIDGSFERLSLRGSAATAAIWSLTIRLPQSLRSLAMTNPDVIRIRVFPKHILRPLIDLLQKYSGVSCCFLYGAVLLQKCVIARERSDCGNLVA